MVPGHGLSYGNGTVISPKGEAPEREDFRAVVLKGRLADAVSRLNPKLPPEAVAEVVHVVLTPEHPSLVQNNRAFHRLLMQGVPVEFANAAGEKEVDLAQLITSFPRGMSTSMFFKLCCRAPRIRIASTRPSPSTTPKLPSLKLERGIHPARLPL